MGHIQLFLFSLFSKITVNNKKKMPKYGVFILLLICVLFLLFRCVELMQGNGKEKILEKKKPNRKTNTGIGMHKKQKSPILTDEINFEDELKTIGAGKLPDPAFPEKPPHPAPRFASMNWEHFGDLEKDDGSKNIWLYQLDPPNAEKSIKKESFDTTWDKLERMDSIWEKNGEHDDAASSAAEKYSEEVKKANENVRTEGRRPPGHESIIATRNVNNGELEAAVPHSTALARESAFEEDNWLLDAADAKEGKEGHAGKSKSYWKSFETQTGQMESIVGKNYEANAATFVTSASSSMSKRWDQKSLAGKDGTDERKRLGQKSEGEVTHRNGEIVPSMYERRMSRINEKKEETDAASVTTSVSSSSKESDQQGLDDGRRTGTDGRKRLMLKHDGKDINLEKGKEQEKVKLTQNVPSMNEDADEGDEGKEEIILWKGLHGRMGNAEMVIKGTEATVDGENKLAKNGEDIKQHEDGNGPIRMEEKEASLVGHLMPRQWLTREELIARSRAVLETVVIEEPKKRGEKPRVKLLNIDGKSLEEMDGKESSLVIAKATITENTGSLKSEGQSSKMAIRPSSSSSSTSTGSRASAQSKASLSVSSSLSRSTVKLDKSRTVGTQRNPAKVKVEQKDKPTQPGTLARSIMPTAVAGSKPPLAAVKPKNLYILKSGGSSPERSRRTGPPVESTRKVLPVDVTRKGPFNRIALLNTTRQLPSMATNLAEEKAPNPAEGFRQMNPRPPKGASRTGPVESPRIGEISKPRPLSPNTTEEVKQINRRHLLANEAKRELVQIYNSLMESSQSEIDQIIAEMKESTEEDLLKVQENAILDARHIRICQKLVEWANGGQNSYELEDMKKMAKLSRRVTELGGNLELKLLKSQLDELLEEGPFAILDETIKAKIEQIPLPYESVNILQTV